MGFIETATRLVAEVTLPDPVTRAGRMVVSALPAVSWVFDKEAEAAHGMVFRSPNMPILLTTSIELPSCFSASLCPRRKYSVVVITRPATPRE
jgi:hypothetical protein